MTTTAPRTHRSFAWLRPLGWTLAALLVALPAILMRVAPGAGFDWTLGDFIFAAILIGGAGLIVEGIIHGSRNWSAVFGGAIAVLTAFVTIWVNLAVGYIGSEDNDYNMWFFAVVMVAIVGAGAVRFRSAGLAWVMAATAAAHLIVGAVGYPQDTRTAPFTLIITSLWLASAALFGRAARKAAAG